MLHSNTPPGSSAQHIYREVLGLPLDFADDLGAALSLRRAQQQPEFATP